MNSDIKIQSVDIIPLTADRLMLKLNHLNELDRELDRAKIQYKEINKLIKTIQVEYNKTVQEIKGYPDTDVPTNNGNAPNADSIIVMKKIRTKKPKREAKEIKKN